MTNGEMKEIVALKKQGIIGFMWDGTICDSLGDCEYIYCATDTARLKARELANATMPKAFAYPAMFQFDGDGYAEVNVMGEILANMAFIANVGEG